MVGLLVFAGCSSPALEELPECHLSVIWDQVEPVGSGPFEIEHHSNSTLAFGVENAVQGCSDSPLFVHWFVDYDSELDPIAPSSGPTFLLNGCHPKMLGAYPKTVIVEALATHGELTIDAQHSDPRVTVAGETIQHIVWAVVVSEHPGTDCR
jgi:hypothetical protein